MEAVLEPVWNESTAAEPLPKPSAARRAVAALFFINGMLMATWVSRIPAVQAAHGLGNGALGLALLAVAGGAVVAMPLCGALMSRIGSDRISQIGALCYSALLPVLMLAPNGAFFAAVLFVFGFSHGALDVAMNAQAVEVEKRYRAPIMASLHALFSTGGFVGAGLGSFIAGHGLSPLFHFSLVGGGLGVATFLTFPHLLRMEIHRSSRVVAKRGFRLPSRGLVALGAMALCTMIGEGAMADWSAVYLRNVIGTTEGLAALGYVAFSIAMLGGRFIGDWITARANSVWQLRVSGALAAGGLLAALLIDQPIAILVGLAGVGLGLSTVVPVVFSAAGRIPGMAPGVALASVTTIGYLGFLAGPPFIGFLAELTGLRLALGLIVGTSLLIVALASTLRKTHS